VVSLDNFIPEIWAARLLSNLNKTLVLAQPGVTNRDYEGEISAAGDTVRISSIGRVTVRDYTKNTDIVTPDDLTDAQSLLLIDQQKYFNFQIDDIDQAQQKPKVMNEAMGEAAYALADQVDTYMAGLYTDADAANLVGSSGSPKADLGTAGKAYEYLVDLSVELDEANVPDSSRWAVVPPWYEGALLKDDRFVSFGTVANVGNLSNGMIGRAAGFDILKSNNVSNNATTWRIMAGTSMAMSMADQITETEAYRPEKRFGDAMKGLHVWGAKVVRPQGLAVLYANKP
jgi:N4-gp56 family major capsid protein